MRITRIALTVLSFFLFSPPVASASDQAPVPTIQSLFLGDNTCPDHIFSCNYPGLLARYRYLHVLLHDEPGNTDWVVQMAPECQLEGSLIAGSEPVHSDGFLEVVIGAARLIGVATCYRFRGHDGSPMTYYAAYFDQSREPDASLWYPRYQVSEGRPDLPDLDVTNIERAPTYSYDAVPNRPAPGQPVVFTAKVRNAGLETVEPFRYTWRLDGRVIVTGNFEGTVSPGVDVSLSIPWIWSGAPHELSFEVAADQRQISTSNDRLRIRTDALSLGFWVEHSAYHYFEVHQWRYCVPHTCLGSDSFEDWLQRQVAIWNRVMARAKYRSTSPSGVADRVAVAGIHVVEDGTLPLHGGRATNNPDNSERTVDLAWGLPARNVQLTYRHGARDGAFNIDWALLHELGHARSLADLYRFDMPSIPQNTITALDSTGRPAFDPVHPYDPDRPLRAFISGRDETFIYQNREQDLMSCDCTQYYSDYSAMTLNRLRGRRASCGNTNPPCNLGDWFADIPPINVLRIVTSRGRSVPPGTVVRLYYDSGRSYTAHIFEDADRTIETVSRGAVYLPADPFNAAGSRNLEGHNLLLLDVIGQWGDYFCFIEPTILNRAYWEGYRDRLHPAVYNLRIGSSVQNGCNLVGPPSLVNEPFSTSPIASTAILSVTGQSRGAPVRWLTVRLLDDSRPARPMRARRIEIVDARGLTLGTGRSNSSGVARIRLKTRRPPARIVDVTDNWLSWPIERQRLVRDHAIRGRTVSG